MAEQKQNDQVLAEGLLARLVLEQAADVVVVCDDKGQITRVSRTAEQLCGCSPLRADFGAAFPVVLASPLLGGDLIANALRGALLRAEPATLTRVDGSKADLLLSATPLQTADGRTIGCVVTMVDVSEHRRADEALRASEARFRSVLENSRDVIYRLNVQTGRYEYISPAVETVVGFSPNELAAMDADTSQAMIHPDDAPAMRAAVARLETAGTADVEYRQRAKNGDYRWLSNHMSLAKDSTGRPLYRNGNIRDITERKQAETEREGLLAELKAIVSSVPDGLITYKLGVSAATINPAAHRILGVSPEDWPRTVAERARLMQVRNEAGLPVDPDASPAARALRGETVASEIMRLQRPDDKERWLSVGAAPIIAATGEQIGALTLFSDITERRQAEEALRQSEVRHRALFDNSIDAIFLTAPDGRVFAANQVACRIFGMTEEELIRAGREGITDWSDPRHGPALAERARSGHLRQELGYVRKDGTKFTAEVSSVILPDRTTSFVILRDITERKRAEEALERSKQRLAEVLDSIEDDFYVLDRDWRFIFASEHFTSRIGKRPEDFLGRNIWEMFPKHLGTVYEENLRAAMDKRETRRFEIGGKYTDAWYRMTVSPSAEGLTVLGTEITENKRIEQALRASERLYRAIGESIDYGIWVCAPDGRNTYASQSFLDLVGLTQEQCSSFGWGDVLHPDDAERTIAAWKDCVRTGSPWDIEHRFRGVDGKWHPVLARGVPVKDEQGKITCWAGINLDISALKKTEAALREADQRKNEFLAVLSHELRNPLAPIRNSTYILERCEPGGDQAKRALAVIDRQAAQLAHLVDDLLDVTRITRNKIQLQRQTLDLNELVRHTVEDHRTLFDRADVRVEFHPASNPMFVSADRNRLAQVMGNLRQNAAKFTGRGGETRITISADATERRAVIQVADTGVGMTPELVARLFQPFSQADSTLDRSKGGLGLGLALAKGLVELHGGDIAVRSAGLGQGAEFVVRLPLAMDDAVAPRPTATAGKGRRRVLVIEDNVDAADSLRDVLAFGEHEVEVAYNGRQGIAKAQEFRPDIVFCDIGLPGMDGFEVARAFRADEALKGVFLVALSGYALPEDVARAQAAGFDRHLAKPPSLETLEKSLAEVP